MIPNDFQIPKEEKKEYLPLPKNIYQVEITDISLVDATGKFKQEGEKNFCFQFTLLAGKDKDTDLRGRNLWNNFVKTTLFIGKKGKNNLWQIIEAVKGRELTREEEAMGLTGADINALIGKQVKVFCDQKMSGEKMFNNITSYIHPESLLTPLTAEEKENAKVKKTKELAESLSEANVEVESIDVESIPFN